MPGDDDSHDDGERTRIGGLPPPIPKPSAAATPAAPVAGEEGERTQIAPARPPVAPGAPPAAPAAVAPGADDPGERTQIVSGAPPRPAPAAAPSAPVANDPGERTQIVGGAPPRPTPATPPAATEGGERTQVVASPPPGATRAAPAPAAAAPAKAAPAVAAPSAAATPAAPLADVTVDPARRRAGADDEERTVILTRSVQSTMHLERVKPAGTAEVIDLDRPNLVLGRGHECDVKLRTPTASREHAKIFFQNGQWTISSLENKTLYIDGARHAGGTFRLVNGMRVRLGDDEFLVVDSAGGTAGAHGSGGLWARVLSFVRELVGRRG